MYSILIIAPHVGLLERGAETFTRELIENLSNNWDITVVTGKNIHFSNPRVKQLALESFKLPGWYEQLKIIFDLLCNQKPKNFFIRKIIRFILHVWTFIYYVHPDVLYNILFMRHLSKENILDVGDWDIFFPQNGLIGVSWVKQRIKKDQKIIATGHGGIGRGEYLTLKKGVDKYICISKSAEKWAKKYSKQIEYIPNGVSVDKFKIDKFSKAKNHEHTVLSVGALTEFKRHELTIKAMKHVKNSKLIIIGKGELEKNLINLCEKMLPGRYEIRGCKYEEMPDIYSKADLFVLPSQNEPMGIVYLEAMSAGLAIVAPDDSDRHEILHKYAYFVDVTNEIQYAETIINALKRGPPKNNGQVYVKEKYSWEIIAKRYETVFFEILK